MRTWLIISLLYLLSACSVVEGMVKDVQPNKDGSVTLQKCDLKVYFALYGLIAAEKECREEIKHVR